MSQAKRELGRLARAGFYLLGALVCAGFAIHAVTGSAVASVCAPAAWVLYMKAVAELP